MPSAHCRAKYVRCPRHGENVAKVTPKEAEALGIPFGCQGCTTELEAGPDVLTMTGEERAEELERWLMSPLMVAFHRIHKRTEELVGRPVWTHEIARAERLVEEARSQQHPVDLEAHIIGSLDQLAGNKPVIIARIDGGERAAT